KMKKIDVPLKNALKEFLEPYGFKKVRGRYPYFVKVINDEIIEVITFRNLIGMGYLTIGGLATVYGREIDFSMSPRYNGDWIDLYDGGVYECLKAENGGQLDIPEPHYPLIELDIAEEDFQQAIELAVNTVRDVLVPAFARVTDLSNCVSFYRQFSGLKLILSPEIKDNEEGLLNFLVYENVEEYQKDTLRLYGLKNTDLLNEMNSYTQEDNRKDKIDRIRRAKEQIRLFTEQRNSPEVLAEIEYRKNLNIKRLKEQKVI
ncbi:MAG: hypothetical protein ACLTFE_04020, partial [Coprococcus eutactus]